MIHPADTFGNIDIYLFDQLLKGRFVKCQTVLDAGCGDGRNLHYFLRNDYAVYGVDKNESILREVKRLAQRLSPNPSPGNFKLALIEEMPFPDKYFDLVICSAVLHFANNHGHFDSMLRKIWSVLKPKGFFFCRLASSIGIEHLITNIGEGIFLLPDETERYLVDERSLLNYTLKLGGQLFEPIKTTNVQNMRCMTTWCVQKT